MLHKYEAIEFIKVISPNSGHNKPWVVMADTEQGAKPYVVKLYDPEQVDLYHCVTKEVICNILATEFELTVPQCALIEIPQQLIVSLSDEVQMQFENSDPRPKFATSYIENANIAIPELEIKHFKKRIKLDTLYAFDNLIRNSDRGFRKTNLLLSPKDAYLIDHEVAFKYEDIFNINLASLQLEDKFTVYHLFYHFLKKSNSQYKRNFFNEFSYFLNNMNINKLNPYFNQLAIEGFNNYSQEICIWLNQIKQNSTTFVDKLKGTL